MVIYRSEFSLSRTSIHGGLRRGAAAAAVGAVLVLSAGVPASQAADGSAEPTASAEVAADGDGVSGLLNGLLGGSGGQTTASPVPTPAPSGSSTPTVTPSPAPRPRPPRQLRRRRPLRRRLPAQRRRALRRRGRLRKVPSRRRPLRRRLARPRMPQVQRQARSRTVSPVPRRRDAGSRSCCGPAHGHSQHQRHAGFGTGTPRERACQPGEHGVRKRGRRGRRTREGLARCGTGGVRRSRWSPFCPDPPGLTSVPDRLTAHAAPNV
ncbi:hypothetical protein AHiyo4_33510 [Arthrobacter sp. Hiyo4]|nr:hypothetical protein AHiyo4_33510 [Arthrobacter sp. Hiyo4]